MPKTGELDQRVTLKSPNAPQNQSGKIVTTFTDVATVWAKVITQRGNEALEAARVNSHRAIRVRIRYRADVTTKWVLRWMGQDYNVTDLDASERRSGNLWLTATSGEVR